MENLKEKLESPLNLGMPPRKLEGNIFKFILIGGSTLEMCLQFLYC